MADGTLKNIEDITTEDSVLSYNVYDKCFEISKVIRTIKQNNNKDLIVLNFSDGTEV
jgi:hypothetical protein